MRPNFSWFLFSAAALAYACAPKPLPYENGPVMSEKNIQRTFKPILEFMEYEPGMTFADVGAGSGALTVMMASLMENSVVYIQDIDTGVLTNDNLDRIIDFYAAQRGRDLRMKNSFVMTIGSAQKTNLPDQTFDLIYSNATVHNFASLDSMVVDLGRKLKPNGVLYLRDSFRNNNGEKIYCSDPKCGKPLLSIEEFLQVMTRNGFRIKRQSPNMSGYPVFGFTWDRSW